MGLFQKLIRIIMVGVIGACLLIQLVAAADPADTKGAQAPAPAQPAAPAKAEGGSVSSTAELDSKKFERYKQEVCEAVPAFGGGDAGAPKWSDVLTETEVLELAFVNMAYGLTSDSVAHLKSELGWKKSVIDMISLITKASCTDEILSEPFLSAAKNLFLYYLTKYQNSNGNETTISEARVNEWSMITKSLTECASDIEPIDINENCGVAISYSEKSGVQTPIAVSVERFDDELKAGLGNVGLDVIIDSVWWMFSTTYARCYSHFYPNEDVILLFYQLFRDDFLSPFLNRWRNVGQMYEHFSIIFGPYDFAAAASNIRKCSSAAYQYEGLAERQLVRPVNVMVDNSLIRNYKV